MAVKSITLKRKDISRNHAVREIAIQFDTANYTTGGFTVDLTSMSNPKKIPHGKFSGVGSSTLSLPANTDIAAMQSIDGYDFTLQQAAASPTLKNYVIQVWASGGAELSAGAMPAALQATDIPFSVMTPLKYE